MLLLPTLSYQQYCSDVPVGETDEWNQHCQRELNQISKPKEISTVKIGYDMQGWINHEADYQRPYKEKETYKGQKGGKGAYKGHLQNIKCLQYMQ